MYIAFGQASIPVRLAGAGSHCTAGIVDPIPVSKTQKLQKSYDFRSFSGGRYRTRTCDPLHVNAKFKFFLTSFIDLQPYPLQTACFPALFKHRVSGCSAALCGRLCGQTVGAIGLAIWRLTQMWSNCGLPFLPQKLTVPLFYMLSQGCF